MTMVTKPKRRRAAQNGSCTEVEIDQLRQQMRDMLDVVSDLAKLIIAMTARLDHVQTLAERAQEKTSGHDSTLSIDSSANKRRLDH